MHPPIPASQTAFKGQKGLYVYIETVVKRLLYGCLSAFEHSQLSSLFHSSKSKGSVKAEKKRPNH